MSSRTKVLSVHVLRRTARKRERALTAGLDAMLSGGVSVKLDDNGNFRLSGWGAPQDELPSWVRGFRVEKAGLLQWAVVATEHRGH